MSYKESWTAISAMIQGLEKSGTLFGLLQSYQKEDSYGSGEYLRVQCENVISSIEQFSTDYSKALPSVVAKRISFFLSKPLAQAPKDSVTGARGARGSIVGLIALDAEITFLLSSRQERLRATSERAFLLLQRLLVVDDDYRAKWQQAIKKGEIACERLGAIHFLRLGIFSFKIDAIGARTDLIFPEPIDDNILSKGVDGLVLTEWKLVTETNAVKKFDEARKQSDLYGKGPLATSELRDYRYLIGVSESALPATSLPADFITPNGVTYRHINICTNPQSPSVTARA